MMGGDGTDGGMGGDGVSDDSFVSIAVCATLTKDLTMLALEGAGDA